LGLSFGVGERDTVCASFQGFPELQGYNGILHGGVVSALLDAAMTHCLFHRGVEAVTGDLRVRFLRPVPCSSVLQLQARVLSEKPPFYRLRAEVYRREELMAWAEAKFMHCGVVEK
jgi:acyl-coenzyme A thioesterase PaaI-like protein